MKKITFIIAFLTIASCLTSCTADEIAPAKKPNPTTACQKDGDDITPPPPQPPIKY